MSLQYVSRTLNEAERNYSPLEKLALSLINMTRRLRRYFESHLVKVITDQPIKNILNRTEASGKLAKYAVEIGTYKISFIPRNAVKGQVLADFLSDAPDGEREDEYFRSPEVSPGIDDAETWTLYTDGAASSKGSGAGLILTGPSRVEYAYALRLTFASTNNEAEYEALLAGLPSKGSMIKYLAKARKYISEFKTFSIENIPRGNNQKADVLSKLATVPFHHLTKEILVEVLSERSTEVQEVQTIVEEEGNNWMTPIIKYLEEGIVPSDKNEARALQNYVIREIHMGSCGMHVGPRAVVRKAMRQGYYWPTMHADAKTEAYHTSIKQSNGETPFSLTYGSEVVIPAEIGMPSYRTLMIREEFNEEGARLKPGLTTKNRRKQPVIREARYKSKMEQYYNKKVRPAGFRPGEFVYQRNEASRVEDQGKLGPNWEGPYRVTEAFENGSYKLQTMEDKIVPRTWHAINLRKCYL
ncbi:reverse transcriptase domain-containing protein [Tanacetum coccineum]